MRFLNASILPRKFLNRNLKTWGFPLGNLLPKTRVLERCVLDRKRKPNANASVLEKLRFRTLRSLPSDTPILGDTPSDAFQDTSGPNFKAPKDSCSWSGISTAAFWFLFTSGGFSYLKALLMGLFLMGCFPGDFQERKRPIKAFGETAH